MDNNDLLKAIQAASIHKKVSNYAINNIKPKMSLLEIANLIENKINELINYNILDPLNRGIAFPTGLSLNNCAAHYTPNYNEKPILFDEKDILKIDFGVHKNGIIIDSAFTISFNPEYEEFINISKNLTNYAVSLCGPDVILGELGESIEEYILSKEITIDNKIYSLMTMQDLCGHSIKHYEIHGGKAVPNRKIDYPYRMNEYEFYAIEPFLTTGKGKSIYKEPTSHYMLNKNYQFNISDLNKQEKNLLSIILKNYNTLPFCQRWLYNNSSNIINYDILLSKLVNKNILQSYPPIYDINNSIISQFEHTIFIKPNGKIQLT
jgi:methionyl aminopeptidase